MTLLAVLNLSAMDASQPSPQLSPLALAACRQAYERGATFQALADRHGIAERTMRRLLVAIGVTPRPRGTAPVELSPLVLEDARAGLSAHAIARKHGANRHRVNAVLRAHGLARAPRQYVLDPLGSKVTNMQARLRRKPPVAVPVRTPAERLAQHVWSPAEAAAIEYEIRAGRFTRAARGTSGLPERLTWHELRRQSWLALHGQAA